MKEIELVRAGNTEVTLTPVQNRGKDFIHLAWYWAGERRQKMLRCKDRHDEARIRSTAREIASAVWKNQPERIDDFGINVRVMKSAREALNGFDIEIDAACREYAQARKIIGESGTVLHAAEAFARQHANKVRTVTVQAAVKEYLAELKQHVADQTISTRHLQDSRSRLTRFADEFQGFIGDVTTTELRSWLKRLPIAPRTRNNFHERIKAFSNWCKEEGYLPKNVPTAADALKKREAPTEIRIFDAPSFRRLLYAAAEEKPELVPYLVIGTFAFVRPKEMERLKGENIRFVHNDIEVGAKQAKRTRRRVHRRLVAMQPNLRAWLEVFPVAPDQPIATSWTRNQVAALAKRAGVEWAHDIMRHTGISYAVALTANVDQVALWAGNSRQIIYGSYLNQVTPAEAAEFYGMMPPQEEKIIRLSGSST